MFAACLQDVVATRLLRQHGELISLVSSIGKADTYRLPWASSILPIAHIHVHAVCVCVRAYACACMANLTVAGLQ